jgi:PAS domain-containing protein
MKQIKKPVRHELAKPAAVQIESDTRYQWLFETTQDGILILDGKTGEITDVNPFLLRMLFYSDEEFLRLDLPGNLAN